MSYQVRLIEETRGVETRRRGDISVGIEPHQLTPLHRVTASVHDKFLTGDDMRGGASTKSFPARGWERGKLKKIVAIAENI